MLEKLINYLKNKKILILGCGLEGYSTYKFIKKHLPEQTIYISDANPNFLERFEDIKNDANAVIIPTEDYLKKLEDYDVIMKTPGVSFKDIDISKFEEKIMSQLELFLKYVNVFTIGVTGTKGKSTTSSLIYSIIKEQCPDVHFLGNIGVPLFDEIDELTSNSIVVLELSSHQLEFTNVSPNVSILLNLFEEHLDHYKSYEHYINAKLNICRFQKKDDEFIYSIDNECLRNHIENLRKKLPQNVYEVSLIGQNKVYSGDSIVTRNDDKVIMDDNEIIYEDSDRRNILGEHNLNNIMFAMTVARIMKLDLNRAQESVYKFMPLPHRMEFVGIYDGVKYYNDSIATIPASTINGVETLKNVNTLIIGGKDRGIDYSDLVEFLNKSSISNLVCLPDTGWKVADLIKNDEMKIYKVQDMYKAVETAKKVTEKNTICLLSPAASSYGFFKNFQERGNLFKQLVKGEV